MASCHGYSAPGDVRTIELAGEGHALRALIRAVARFGDVRPAGDDVHDATPRRDEAARGRRGGRAMESVHPVGQRVEPLDPVADARRTGVSLGAQHDVDEGALAETHRIPGDVLL